MLFLLVLTCLMVSQNVGTTTEKQLNYMSNHMKALTRQVMLQQFFTEQRVRTEGPSGLKVNRIRSAGNKNYYVNTHSGYSAAAIHDHANNDRTIGMGEFTAVLNGIEFQTRHNDYRLYMPHRTSKGYHAFEKIPFPDVPPEVTNKTTVDEQILEMREWFKAWRDQKYSKRDYRKYFKPILCYLEGHWGESSKNIDEPFESDRHFIDAASWMELHEKFRYLAYSGAKSRLENLSFLPTKIMSLINDTIPSFGQWNYRIMCHPLKRDLPLERFRVVEDLSARMLTNRDIHQYANSRSARFELKQNDEDKLYERPRKWKFFIDQLMEEIPGKDNYQSNLEDEGFDTPALKPDKTKINAGYYHRFYVMSPDAMGASNQLRGYNDQYFFAALNSQKKVATVPYRKCKNARDPKTCYMLKQKWSYAIPLEIIYMTPLYKWNPFNLKHHGDQNWDNYKLVTGNKKRTGACSSTDKAFNGTTSKMYYLTPSQFYTGSEVSDKSAADTARGTTCVLDRDGTPRAVRASGTHVFLPQIKDVGILRTRYPIFPVHGEGSSVWKELNALREVTMNQEQWKQMYWKHADLDVSNVSDMTFEMAYSNRAGITKHTHALEISAEEYLMLKGGLRLEKVTEQSNSHSHRVRIRMVNDKIQFDQCDGNWACWDKHGKWFTIINQ